MIAFDILTRTLLTSFPIERFLLFRPEFPESGELSKFNRRTRWPGELGQKPTLGAPPVSVRIFPSSKGSGQARSQSWLRMVALADLGEAGAELGGGFAMAEKAESAEVIEVALTAAFGYGADVVGVP